jgi:hypothetical protein
MQMIEEYALGIRTIVNADHEPRVSAAGAHSARAHG